MEKLIFLVGVCTALNGLCNNQNVRDLMFFPEEGSFWGLTSLDNSASHPDHLIYCEVEMT